MNRTPAEHSPRVAWSTGRYPSLAPNLLPAIARLVDAAGLDPGDRVLDVGCGTGNVALTAARSGADVVGVDLSRGMLETARESAALADHAVAWLQGDAETLPFRSGAFDAVLSNFGHVFAPDATRAGEELLRVTRSGGRLAFTAWAPDGVVGDLTEVLADGIADPPGDPWAHLAWGRPEVVRERLGDRADLSVQRRIVRFRYVSPAHFWREFAEESGPLSPVVGRLPEDQRASLRAAALSALEEWFGGNAVRVEYLQVRAIVD